MKKQETGLRRTIMSNEVFRKFNINRVYVADINIQKRIKITRSTKSGTKHQLTKVKRLIETLRINWHKT